MNEAMEWPSEGWQQAMQEQTTPQTIEAALRCAAIEIARLRRHGLAVDWEADDLVQRVLTATCAGRLTWSPGAVSLRSHLHDALRAASRDLRRRAGVGGRTVLVALDDLDDEDPVLGEPGLVADGLAEQVAVADLAEQLEAELWHRLAGDQVALQVLRVMATGDTASGDIVDVTGLPLAVVNAAKRRLRRMAVHVPQALVVDIRAALRLEASADGVA